MDKFEPLSFCTQDGLTLIGDACGSRSSPPVVLLHGGGQTRHAWAGAMRRLASMGYYVIAYDARGHGDSDWSPDGEYAVPHMAGDLAEVLQWIGRPAAIVGASIGALTGFYCIGSGKGPTASALVMVDVTLKPTQEGFERIRNFMMAHVGGFATLDEAAEAVASYNPARPRPSDPKGLMKNLRQRADDRLYWHWDPRFVPTSVKEREQLLLSVSGGVTVPLLLLRGEHSDVVNAAGVAQLKSHVPHVEVQEVAGAGHMITGDRNDAFLEAMLPFLRRNAAPAF